MERGGGGNVARMDVFTSSRNKKMSEWNHAGDEPTASDEDGMHSRAQFKVVPFTRRESPPRN